jgi:hypothetical protein
MVSFLFSNSALFFGNRRKPNLNLYHFKQTTGWIQRRQEESAKTISQIHNEAAQEERARRSSSTNALRSIAKGNIRRGVSSGDVRVLDKQKPTVDDDGFVSVVKSKTVHRSSSMTAMPQRSQSEGAWQKYPNTNHGSTTGTNVNNKSKNDTDTSDTITATMTFPTPEVCGEKAKNILKEFFVGGDTDDAILSIHELVGVGSDGSTLRGNKVVESAILTVLEMKRQHVDQFLSLYIRCFRENKIESSSFVAGLNDPLEFLSDIAVDAPLATLHLVRIVSEWIKADILKLEFLLDSPEYFRTDQNAARFGAQVVKCLGGEAVGNREYMEVIGKLMTEEDKVRYSSVQEIMDSV